MAFLLRSLKVTHRQLVEKGNLAASFAELAKKYQEENMHLRHMLEERMRK